MVNGVLTWGFTTASEIEQALSAYTLTRLPGYAFVTLRTPSGMVFLNEASYTFPTTGSDSERKIAAEKALVRAADTGGDGVQIIGPGRNETLKAPPDFVGSWPGVVKDCLDRIGRGEPPPASVRDCARAVTLTFDAYRMAGEKPAGPQR